MNTEQFFDAILPAQGRRCAGQLQNKVFANYFSATNEDLAEAVRRIDAKQTDAYFALGGYGPPDSRKQENVVALRSLWLDIDTQEGKPNAYYPDRKAAMVALTTFAQAVGLPNPLVVSSGYGIHAYWPFEDDCAPDVWAGVAGKLKAAAKKAALDIDNSRTTDSSSVLRPPGTSNRKNGNAKLVKIIQDGVAVPLEVLDRAFSAYIGEDDLGPAPRRAVTLNSDLTGGMEYPPSSGRIVADHCGVVGLVRDTGGNTSQPTWYGVIGVLTATTEGEDLAHEWSNGYAGYSHAETSAKYAQASAHGPTTCAKLGESEPEICAACPHFGKIKSPILLGYRETGLAPSSFAPSATPLTIPGSTVQNSASSLPTTMGPEEALVAINQLYAFAHNWGGSSTYLRTEADGTVRPTTREEIGNALANRRVQLPDGRVVPAAKFWPSSAGRREYDDVVFDPERQDPRIATGRVLNLWRGYGRKAGRGVCRRMLRHLWIVVCRRNRAHFRYLMMLLAYIVQRPGSSPRVVLVLRSLKEGSGKTTVGQWLVSMFDGHSMMLNTTIQLIGRFNSHLQGQRLIVVNEPSWAGDKDATAKLKSMITDPWLTIERKHGSTFQIPNTLAYIFTTNAEWAVSAGSGARRYFILDVDESFANDAAYFDPLHAEAENGGIEALLYMLQNLKIDRFNPAKAPITEALRQQQMMSLSSQADWALDLIEREPDLSASSNGLLKFGASVASAVIFADYADFVKARNIRPMSQARFGIWLGQLGLTPRRSAQGRYWDLPAASEFGEAVLRAAGVHK